MMRLLRVELRRLFSRRLTIVAVVAAVVVSGLVVFGLAMGAKPPSGAELQIQQQNLEQSQKEWKQNGPQMIKDCQEDQAQERKTNPSADFGCEQMGPPAAVDFGKPPPELAKLTPQGLQAASYLLVFIAFILGAGFVSAEFSTGAIGNWLTFEPRRLRVYASKLGAVSLGMILLAIIVAGIIGAGIWLICNAWGSTALTGAQRNGLAWSGVRVVVLAGAAALAGAAMGALLRHTAAVIGVAMAYAVLIEGILAQMVAKSRPWLAITNIDAWVAHGTTYGLEDCRSTPGQGYLCNFIQKDVSFLHGTLYLGIATLALVLLAGWLFQRRDIN